MNRAERRRKRSRERRGIFEAYDPAIHEIKLTEKGRQYFLGASSNETLAVLMDRDVEDIAKAIAALEEIVARTMQDDPEERDDPAIVASFSDADLETLFDVVYAREAQRAGLLDEQGRPILEDGTLVFQG